MATQFYHAHDGGNDACLIPPGYGWACPYPSKAGADIARDSRIGQLYAPVYAALSRGDREVTREEIAKADAIETARTGGIYNGCTIIGLRSLLGDGVYHAPGYGWLVPAS